MKHIAEKALLVNVTICQWSARKTDKRISQKIAKDHNAHNAGNFNKILIAEQELKKIQSIAGSTRDFLYNNTLPWGDNGDRLLPATNYFEFVARFREHKTDFEIAVENFIHEYPALKSEAQTRLNGMFQESDYPSTSVIKNKFDMEISFMPISNTKDFRLEVDQEEVNALKTKIEAEINDRITQSTQHIWKKMQTAVQHMVEKLSEKEAIFRDSLVENIQELIEILPRLNFTQDTAIENTIDDMKALLVDPEILRKNNSIRNQKANEAKAILNKISGFLA